MTFQLPGYVIDGMIAQGGMAVVYRAREAKTNRPVALKLILPHAAQDPEFISRFRHEVHIHSQLKHPNILEIFEVGAGPHYYIAMELVDGGPLRMVMDRTPKFPPEVAVFVAREILNGLASAHARGIVHRDMKPQNVLINRKGEVKVSDFGISKTAGMTKLTATGSVIGTPAYMSPEQALGQPIDARSDVFSAGVVLYEMLAGANPFMTENPATSMRRIVDMVPPRLFDTDPLIPVECDRTVERMIAKSPALRYQEAQIASDALSALLQAITAGNPRDAFLEFLYRPKEYLEARSRKLFELHSGRARSLLSSGAASDEVVLWELYQAGLLMPDHANTRVLMTQISQKAGYRVEPAEPKGKAQELETRLKQEPDNPALLLQLAKLYKLEKDYVRMMRAFFRLKTLDIQDPYVSGQVAALVARPGATQVLAATDGGGPPGALPRPSPARPPAGPGPGISRPSLEAEKNPAKPDQEAPVTVKSKPRVPPLVILGATVSILSTVTGLLMLLAR